MDSWLDAVLQALSLTQYSLGTVFIVSFLSATLLPLGSEPVVMGLVSLNPSLFWPIMGVATAGNTLGGAVNWWMGFGAQKIATRFVHAGMQLRALRWLQKLGPKACLLAWLPVVGDPLCTVAGWLKLPFWPCVAYMAIGKFLRYLVMTSALAHWLN